MSDGPDEWLAEIRELNERKKVEPGRMTVSMAHLHGGDVSASFMHSWQNALLYDMQRHRRILPEDSGKLGFIGAQSGAGRLERARNESVALWLDSHDSDALIFIDSDMGFEMEAVEMLAAVMEDDPERFPILGGLCFGAKPVGLGEAQSMQMHWFPTLYSWGEHGERLGWNTEYEYPKDTVVEVGATGSAFLMISRDCAESIRAEKGDHWFDPVTIPLPDGDTQTFGEDLSFCMTARSLGFSVHVHTGAKTSHKKSVWLTEDFYESQRRPSAQGVTVVIPVKDNLKMTRDLVAELVSQGGYDDLLLFDNGSGDEMKEWFDGNHAFDVFDAEGATIHEMWNAGLLEAKARHRGRSDVIFLNNDVRVGPSFCQRLITGLHSDPGLVAVSGNYDGREGDGVIPVTGICANRYNGEGGLAGFGFALSADWVKEWEFDERFSWWYGDNDLCLSIDRLEGAWYGVVADALMEHVGGGSQTETPDNWDELIAADRAAFMEKWNLVDGTD